MRTQLSNQRGTGTDTGWYLTVLLILLVVVIVGPAACASRSDRITLTVDQVRELEACVLDAVADRDDLGNGQIEAGNCVERLLPPGTR